MKGALGLIAIAVVIWAFWMSWEWLRNYNKPKREKKK
jgi:CDP-diglyceride synthetase